MSIQIPNLHTSNRTKATAESATVLIKRRQDATHAGEFTVNGGLKFDPAADIYPSGNLKIKIDLNDSAKGVVIVKTVEQLDTTGRATPTTYATGRCDIDSDAKAIGCRYWIMLVDNKRAREEQTPDIISFLIYDRTGKRVAYGSGPVVKGDVIISPTAE
jgi:hypothetical protein